MARRRQAVAPSVKRVTEHHGTQKEQRTCAHEVNTRVLTFQTVRHYSALSSRNDVVTRNDFDAIQ